MSDLIVINGPIGAGKSTVARLLARRLAREGLFAADVDLDDVVFMQHLREASFDPVWERGWRAHASLVNEWFRLGADVVIAHGPLYADFQVASLLRGPRTWDRTWHALFRVSYDVALERVTNDDERRPDAGSRDPGFLRSSHDWFATLQSGIAVDWEIDTAHTSPGEIVSRLAADVMAARDVAPDVVLQTHASGSGPRCRAILDQLPTWFGVPEANDEYVERADRQPTTIARVDGRDAGLLIIDNYTDKSAEVHLLAVVPDLHRRGIGTALLRHAERELRADGYEYLQVKTLSARNPDAGYAKTRAFYEAYGFRSLEEWPALWDPSNPALQMVKSI